MTDRVTGGWPLARLTPDAGGGAGPAADSAMGVDEEQILRTGG